MGSLPSILRPEFTWPCPIQPHISESTPPLPYLPSKFLRRIIAPLHEYLYPFSEKYCAWFDIPFDRDILQLPFGLVLKWSDRASIEEVAAMKMARAAGMPVPLVLTCGDHPNHVRRFSILMTRLAGICLNNDNEPLHPEIEQPWLSQLYSCLTAMRKWKSPYGKRICSVLGTTIWSTRVPFHKMGPFETEAEMHDFLFEPQSSHAFPSKEAFQTTLQLANEIRGFEHRITFTQGDLKAHNILVGDDNQLAGFLDWESGGWYPEYWEHSTAMRWGRNSWWYQVATYLGGDQYQKQVECDRALNNLTVDSYIAF